MAFLTGGLDSRSIVGLLRARGTTVHAFYFARLVVDPTDYNRIYKPGLSLSFSQDGGTSFAGANIINGSSVHSDHHALWVNPKDPAQMFLGTDGAWHGTGTAASGS